MNKKRKFAGISGKKKKTAELLIDPDSSLTVTELCEQVGISRTTFYNWQEDGEFKEYVGFLIDSYTESELINIWKAIIKKASCGDVPAQKLYFELKNKYKQQIELSGDVVIISGEDELDG